MSKTVAPVFALLLAGCATQVPQALPPQMTPQKFTGPIAADARVWPEPAWWQGFGDPQLTALINQAQDGNRDIAVAAARVMQAEAQSTIQRSALFPQIGGQAQGQRGGCSGQACSQFPNGRQFGLSFNASYELDFWGLARDNLRAANEQLKAAAEKTAAEKSSLEAQLAVAKDALPLAAQAAGLREQLRQTQDQLGALALENNQLKTRLAVNPAAPGTSNLTPVSVPTTLAPVAVPVAPAAAPRVHVVAAGDTLSKIAVQYYGSASRWPDILAANKEVLKSEKSLLVGTKLKIP